MADFTGRVIRGYELRGSLGAGGFGAVYRAYQPNVGREVAIKVILPDYANQPEFIRRFEIEAQLVARLEHPFIVPLFDYWRDPDGAYLVMRLFRGGSLRSRLQLHNEPFSAESALTLIDQIAGALAVAHRNGVVHRDLKPDNILLDEDGNAYLTDFGIAKIHNAPNLSPDDDIDDEGISGSPGYISPEQIMSSPVTPQTDIYSLGVMIYELLAGKHPFPGSNIGELIIQHLNEPLPHIDDLRPDLPSAANDVIQRATAKEPENRFADALALAAALRAALTENTPIAEDTFSDFDLFIVLNPYKGLRPFEEADSADFFGREALVAQLLDRLAEPADSARFLAVVGPSGSGKSSVVKAGLIPALRKGGLPGSDSWFVAEMLPGTRPLNQLANALLSVATQTTADLESLLRDDPRGLIHAVEQALPERSQFLLMIDQFEEVFTLLENESERTHFLNLIRTAVSDPASRVRIIVTLRADFYDRPLLYEGFGLLMRARTEVVLPLSAEELERAITGPAERVGLLVEANLLAAVVADVREEPGALPLLQYVLTEVFERREGRMLTLSAYQESGGALGALARRADELYQEMDAKSRSATRQLFLRLVTLGEGTEDTRRRVHWAELMSVDSDHSTMQSVLDAFGRYRLLSFDRDPQTREPTVEVAHEALIREWKQLREWLNDSREDVRLQRNLALAAEEWTASSQDSSFLLRGARLAQLEEWAQHTDLALTAHEQDYLRASIAQRTQQEAEEAERRAREAALEAQARNRLRILLAVMSAAAVIAIVLSVFAFRQQQIAQEERDNAEQARGTSDANAVTATVAQGRAEIEANNAQVQANLAAIAAAEARREAEISRSLVQASNANQLNNAGSRPLALALALIANSVPNPPNQVQRVLGEIAYLPGAVRHLNSSDLPVNSVAFSPDGRLAASASDDSIISLWNVETGALVRTLNNHILQVTSIAFSPNGRRLVSGSWDRSLIIWDVDSGTPLQSLAGHRSVIYALAFSPDGQKIASGSVDGIFIWDAATGENRLQFGQAEGNILTLTFSPSGDTLLSGSNDDSIILWDATTGEAVRRFSRYTSDILSVAFSPDGQTALSTSRDTSIVLWDISAGTITRRLGSAGGGHTLQVKSVAFSPNGQTAISASDDESVILWDVASGQLLQHFEPGKGQINTVAISSDGRTALSGSSSGIVTFWNIEGGASLDVFQASAQPITSTAYMPSNPEQLLAASGDGNIYLWDTAGDALIHTFEGHTAAVNSIAAAAPLAEGGISPLLSGSGDATLILWDMETGAIIQHFEGHTASVSSVALSPDGRYALSGSDDRTVILWDVASGEIVRRFGEASNEGHSQRVLTVAFSPDGRTALSGSVDRTLILWDVETGERLHVFEGHSRRVLTAVYSPDGSKALSGSDDGSIILWDLANRREQLRFNTGGESTVEIINSLSYSPDGTMAVSATSAGRIILWNISDGQPFRYIDPASAFSASSPASVETITLSASGQTALTGLADGRVITWRTPPLHDFIAWVYANRDVPELTCSEREQYSVEPPCDNFSSDSATGVRQTNDS